MCVWVSMILLIFKWRPTTNPLWCQCTISSMYQTTNAMYHPTNVPSHYRPTMYHECTIPLPSHHRPTTGAKWGVASGQYNRLHLVFFPSLSTLTVTVLKCKICKKLNRYFAEFSPKKSHKVQIWMRLLHWIAHVIVFLLGLFLHLLVLIGIVVRLGGLHLLELHHSPPSVGI